MAGKAETRTILVVSHGGKHSLVEGVPASAKITFGPINPGSKYDGGAKALRIYTSANNQLAVFTNVESFRDTSLTIKERKVTRQLRGDAVVGPNGRASEDQYEETYEWEAIEL